MLSLVLGLVVYAVPPFVLAFGIFWATRSMPRRARLIARILGIGGVILLLILLALYLFLIVNI